MELTTILYGILKSMLFMVMIFGAFLAFNQMNKGKIRTLFVGYLLIWALLLFLDLFSIASAMMSGGEVPVAHPVVALISVIVSQIVMLWFYYNLLFTFKQSLKIIAAHLAVVAVVLLLIRNTKSSELAQFFYVADSLKLAYENISFQSLCSKALFVLMQLSFSAVALMVSNRIVPIYQSYIEQNESNAAYNLLWIKEIGRIIFLATTVYIYLMVFITNINAIIYYIVLIVVYMRMINILIQRVALKSLDGLYNRLEVKWSWRKMWYVEERVSQELSSVRKQFNQIIEWIKRDRPYANPQFSFKDITMQFEGVTFNDFDALIRKDRGLNFQAYIRECRINYAAELMDVGDDQLLLKEVAFKVGFDSSTAFSRAFKVVKGVAASEWRAMK